MEETLGDSNESFVSLITTMKQSFDTKFSAMSTSMQTNITQLSETFIKNSEADQV